MILIGQQREKCIGCNACVEAAPYRWSISTKDGKCNLVGAINKKRFYHVKVHEDELHDNMRAADNCPVNIIHITKLNC